MDALYMIRLMLSWSSRPEGGKESNPNRWLHASVPIASTDKKNKIVSQMQAAAWDTADAWSVLLTIEIT